MFAVPFVENVHRRVYEVIIENPKSFNMGVWHGQNSCGTTHCRAGWVIELAGEQGYALQKQTSPTFAALQIYKASCPELPVSPYRFHESNELALANIKEYAEKEQQLKMTASPNLTPQPTLQTLIKSW
jgi:tRNA A37 threonylcarbamoyladenosine biosynthesis protein TsaE